MAMSCIVVGNPPPPLLSLSLDNYMACVTLPLISYGDIGLLPLFAKITAICPYFETIKVHVPVLKLDFNKIELQVELDISNVEFYAYFAT